MSFLNILKLELKKSIISILKLSLVLSLFMLLVLLIFDPDMFGDFEKLIANYPQAIIDMVGGAISMSTLSGFITIEFLSMIWIWVGIYIILKAAQDIPTAIDNKSIDLTLSKPIKRWEYSLAKHMRFIISLLIVFISMILMVLLMVNILPNLKNETIDWWEYIAAFFWAFLFCVSLESTAFLFSTFMSRKKASGISFMFLIIYFIIGTYYKYFDESMEGIKYLSIFYYYNPSQIMVNHIFDDVLRNILILSGYSLVLTIVSIIIFNKRDIPV